MPKENDSNKKLATNRKAFHDYFIEDKQEAGIVLLGTEVKSIKQGNVSLLGSYASVEKGQVVLHAMNVSSYDCGSRNNHDPLRKRRLLLHAAEIRKLAQKIDQKGYTLIPLSIYTKRGIVKVEIGLCKGKREYDKRETLKRKTADKETRREMQRRV